MITREQLDIIKKNCKSTFAIWKPKDKNNEKLCGGFPEKYSRTILKPNIVFVGMNLADDSTQAYAFSNFHQNTHNDYKLRDLISNSPFCGAYMTDLFNDVGSNSHEINTKYKADQKKCDNAVKRLLKEIEAINSSKGYIYIICIGSSDIHYKAIGCYLDNHPNPRYVYKFDKPYNGKRYFYIPHHSSRSPYSSSYQEVARKVLNKIEKQIFTNK